MESMVEENRRQRAFTQLLKDKNRCVERGATPPQRDLPLCCRHRSRVTSETGDQHGQSTDQQ